MKRTLLFVILLASFAFVSRSAHAQFAVYGQFNGTHDPNIGWLSGFELGLYDDVYHAGPVHAGFDFRGGHAGGNNYSYHNFLFGPRLAVKPPVLPIRPYIQAEIGLGGTKYSRSGSYDNHFQSGFIGGLDYTVLPHVDLRVPEIGYLHMAGSNLFTLGFGAVVRLP